MMKLERPRFTAFYHDVDWWIKHKNEDEAEGFPWGIFISLEDDLRTGTPRQFKPIHAEDLHHQVMAVKDQIEGSAFDWEYNPNFCNDHLYLGDDQDFMEMGR